MQMFQGEGIDMDIGHGHASLVFQSDTIAIRLFIILDRLRC